MEYEYRELGGVWDAQRLLALVQSELSALAFEYKVNGKGSTDTLRTRLAPLIIGKRARIPIVTEQQRNRRKCAKWRGNLSAEENSAIGKRRNERRREAAKALQDESDAWNFFKTSLKQPLDDSASLPPALASQTAAYSALSQEQKQHLSRVLIPLLLARKDELTTSDHKLYGKLNANGWLRVMSALASFDVARHSHPLDCCLASNVYVDKRSKRPQLSLHISEAQGRVLTNSAVFAAVLAHGVPALVTLKNNQQLPDASHLCKNKRCVSPLHLVFESRMKNQRRDHCINGNAFSCRHKDKCVWVRRGRYLPCRNDSTRHDQVCDKGCDMRCFDFDLDAIAYEDELCDSIRALNEQEDGDALDGNDLDGDALDGDETCHNLLKNEGDDLESQSEGEESTNKRDRNA